MILLLILALPIVFLIYHLHKNNQKSAKQRNLPPHLPGLPLIGNLHQLAKAPIPHVFLSHLSKTHGHLLRLNLGSIPVIVISSAKLAKEVLKTQDSLFCSRPKLVAQRKLSYDGADIAFAPYGPHWREMRRIAAGHLLSPTKVQSFRAVREEEVAKMVAEIARAAPQAVDLSAAAMGLTATLICRIGFGRRYEKQGSEMRRFEELLKELRQLSTAFFVSDYLPALSWVDKVSGLNKRLDSAFEKLDSFYQELINEHLRHHRMAAAEEEEEDILGVQVKLEMKSSEPNWNRVKALLMDIFLGGTDSSAASIVWTMTALMKASNMMQKVQSEIRNAVGSKGRVDDHDLPKLSYLKAVINETLRLYSPVPMLIPRESMEKCVLDGYEIQPKTTVYVNIWAVARDPEYWKDSPEEFLPERFVGGDVDVKGQDFGFIPFGSGRRICPGMFMGLANVELAVANLLYCFDWELPEGVVVDTDVSPGLIMHKKNPLLLVPKHYHA